MTDTVNAFIVILGEDIREDDIEPTINALRQIKGVVDVQPHLFDPDVAIAKAQLRVEVFNKIVDVMREILL